MLSEDANDKLKRSKLQALTPKQERRLMDSLDARLLDITRNYKKRIESSSTLRTLSAYLDALQGVLVMILQIPPIDPSTGLRIAYLLHFTGDALNAIPGYNLEGSPDSSPADSATLKNLVDFLDDLDQAWLAVLQGQLWDPDSREGVDLVVPSVLVQSGRPLKSSPPTQTDLARLRSLLFAGESSLEEWLAAQRKGNGGSGAPEGGEDDEDDDGDGVSLMLARIGLLDQFDCLFVNTLDYLRAFSGNVAQNVVDPPLEVEMECSSC